MNSHGPHGFGWFDGLSRRFRRMSEQQKIIIKRCGTKEKGGCQVDEKFGKNAQETLKAWLKLGNTVKNIYE